LSPLCELSTGPMMANYGAHGGYPKWTEAERSLLRELFPRTPWPALVTAFPGRTRQAILQMGRNVLKIKREINRREKWTTDEIIILRRVYPVVTDDELKATFPRHSFIAVQRMASELGVLRPRWEARQHKRFVHPVIIKLYEERRRQRLNRVQLGKIAGHHQNQILGWELGKTQPDFAAVCDVAQALGLEIVVRKPETIEAVVIPYPEKRQLMGGRA
jgi:hypothetical protein